VSDFRHAIPRDDANREFLDDRAIPANYIIRNKINEGMINISKYGYAVILRTIRNITACGRVQGCSLDPAFITADIGRSIHRR
jgi:hypothetical protein